MKILPQKIAIGAAVLGTLLLVPTTFAYPMNWSNYGNSSFGQNQNQQNWNQPAWNQGWSQQGGNQQNWNNWNKGVNYGQITAINGDSLTVQTSNGTTYTVDATNAPVTLNGQVSSIASLIVGDQIMVQGVASSSNTITAQSVSVDTVNTTATSNETATYGEITALSGNLLTIQNSNGVTYTVDATNAPVTLNGQVSSVASLIVGDQVMVQGIISTSNAITAQSLSANTVTTNQTTTYGEITAINGNLLTVQSSNDVTYTVDVTNAPITLNGVGSSVASLAIGDQVVAQGVASSSNAITAQSLSANTATTVTNPTQPINQSINRPKHRVIKPQKKVIKKVVKKPAKAKKQWK